MGREREEGQRKVRVEGSHNTFKSATETDFWSWQTAKSAIS